MDPELIAKILVYALANGVSVELQTQALAGAVTYEQMVEQHEAQAAANKPLELLIYGVVGAPEDGLDAKTVRQQIVDTSGPIVMRINSGGGLVMEGLAIFNALSDAKAAGRTITVHIDGVAASMASILAMAGDEIIMADNGLMMIHNPWDVAMGDAQAIRKKADVLDKIRDQMVGIYAARTGLTADQLTPLMDATTWMTAQEALEAKFVTSISESSTAKAQIKPVDVTSFGFACVPTNPLIITTQADPSPSTAQASIVSKETDVDPKLIAEILAFAAANGVSAALQSKALLGEITIEEMKAQHAAAQAAANTGVSAADVTRILASAKNLGISDEIRDQALTGAISFTQMMDQHNEALVAADAQNNIVTVRTGRTLDASPADEAAMRAQMLTVNALESIGATVPEALRPNERTRAYGEQSLRSVAAFVNRSNGIILRADASDREVIQAALRVQGPQASSGGVIGTGDLGNVLGQPIRAVFDAGYQDQLAETTYGEYTTEMTVPDFKGLSMVNIGLFSGIKKISEGGKLPLAKLSDGARFVQLDTDGLKISFRREAIINDEFGALISSVNNLGMVVRQDEDDQAMNALVNGIMVEKNEQGAWVETDVFGVEHNNLIEVAALDDDGLAAARLAMRSQRGKGGHRLNITPRILAVSPDLENAALKLIAGQVQASKLADVSTAQAMKLTVIVLDKLPAGTFFVMGAKQFAQIVKVLRLQDGRGPQIYSIPVADRLSLEWGMINDFAAQCINRVGIVKGTVA